MPRSVAHVRSPGVPAALALFAASGGCAAVYQVSWQRLLTLSTGSTTSAVALSVASFLGGLGVGGLLGGRLSLRVAGRQAWMAFAVCETILACCAWAAPAVLGRQAPGWAASAAEGGAVRGMLFLAMLLPAVPMGATLPLLVRAVVEGEQALERRIGLLYACNTLGAAAGAGATPWLLFPWLGIGGASYLAAATTTGVALLAAARGWLVGEPARAPRRWGRALREPRAPALGAPRIRFVWWPVLTFSSGLLAIGLEIVWFRVLDVSVKSTAMTFGSILSVYLAGLALGALAALWLVPRAGHPLGTLLGLQGLAAAGAAAPLLALVRCPPHTPGYDRLVAYWRQYEGLSLLDADRLSALAALYFGLAAFLMGPATALYGASFVWLQRAMQHEASTSGWKVGVTEAARIAGNLAGSLLVGFMLLEHAGTAATARLLVMLGAAFPLCRLVVVGVSWRWVLLAAAIVLLAAALPDNDALWRRFHGEPPEWLLDEDADAVIAAVPALEGEGTYGQRLSVNGQGISWFPYGGVHTQLGLLPAVVHPQPRRAAVVGLGSGDTAWGAALCRDLQHIDVFEICGGMPRLLRRLSAQASWPQLRELLDEPRVRIGRADGRHALTGQPAPYDIIELDALRPQSTLAGHLYSIEFFRLCASRLAPRGIHCQWAPTIRTIRTFCSVYPHVVLLPDGPILLGSAAPMTIDLREARDRLATWDVGSGLAHETLDMLSRARALKLEHLPPGSVNEDLFPRDEFAIGRAAAP